MLAILHLLDHHRGCIQLLSVRLSVAISLYLAPLQIEYTPGKTELTKSSLQRLQQKFQDGIVPSKFVMIFDSQLHLMCKHRNAYF